MRLKRWRRIWEPWEMFGAGGSGSEQGELDFGKTEKNF